MGWWQRYREWRRRHVAALAPTHDGFRLLHGASSMTVRWADVGRIVAFKRDLLTTDLVCLAIEIPAGVVEIHEEMDGYPAVRAAMELALGIGPQWQLAVIPQPFAPNPTEVYSRALQAVPA